MRLPSNSGFVDSYCIGGLSLGMACFHQGRYPVSLRSGKLRVCAHLCLSFLWERKVMMLTRLALYSELMSCTYKLNPGFFKKQLLNVSKKIFSPRSWAISFCKARSFRESPC
uniref:Uncharacterized protein n=1 Tax=Candidatus Kentrum eta TaxID=2126337 RepID=A0A450VEF8_9GAMM|nr:MAG: hypothetical protein BECKH772B_GA0070898_103292 [Candidatus Kentron sp. H]